MMDVDVKEEKIEEFEDCSALVASELPRAVKATQANVESGLEEMLSLEKKTRLARDEKSTSLVMCEIVRTLAGMQRYAELQSSLHLLAKRRKQFKKSIREMVVLAMEISAGIGDAATRQSLVRKLREISEGKIYLETEHARLTMTLARMIQAAGDEAEAARVLQEVQVETYGSMDPKEKIEFILEQMRFALRLGDFIRAQIISRKISPKALVADDVRELKRRFHEQLLLVHVHDGAYLDASRSWRAIVETLPLPAPADAAHAAVSAQRFAALKHVVAYAVLAKHAPDQVDLLARLYQDKEVLELPAFRALLRLFVTKELIDWQRLRAAHGGDLSALSGFADVEEMSAGEKGERQWAALERRVHEHNVRCVAEYYRSVRSGRLGELLGLSEEESERLIADMVSEGGVWAKVDRQKRVIDFRRPKHPNDVLNDWSRDVGKLLELVEQTTHLIDREIMVHGRHLSAKQ